MIQTVCPTCEAEVEGPTGHRAGCPEYAQWLREETLEVIHLLSNDRDLSKPITIAEERHEHEPCPQKGCTRTRGEAVLMLTDGGIRAPCPRCLGAGRIPTAAFYEKLDRVADLILYLVAELARLTDKPA